MQTLAQLQNGELKGATTLKLCEGLTEFPREIFDLADTLVQLELSGNQLTTLPADFSRLRHLKILFCSGNPFTELPAVLGNCPMLEMIGFKSCQIETVPPAALNPNLRWLILTDNRIQQLPESIGNCTRLEKLALAGNQLTQLPAELANCSNLGLIRFSANQLAHFPQWLLAMPRLSWLGFSGNPFCTIPNVPQLQQIPWQNLQMGAVLGQGASGIIFKAVLQQNGTNKHVAVKVYKGAVTSDGSPEDEMNATIVAGIHHGLVTNLGQLTGHPEGKMGLVMELIPPQYSNLGLPPSFESCTRDVFTPGSQLTPQQAIKIAATIASAAAHLHSKGIINGDLYAHNTLINAEGNALMGDFGAAAFYNTTNPTLAPALHRIEVRAFGCLLDDLLQLCHHHPSTPQLTLLKTLRDSCWQLNVLARPGFEELYNALVG